MEKNDCIYFNTCSTKCQQSCLRYEEMKFMSEHSNIPKAKQRFNVITPDDCDLQAFEHLADIRNQIERFVYEGENLYLYSTTCGNGKTTWSIKLMLQYFNEVWPCNNFTERGIFVNVNSFLFDLKASFDKYNEYVEDLKRKIPDIDLVIWDDVASGRMSQYDTDLILSLLDKRISNNKANIFTGNILPSKLVDSVGDRLKSRICGNEVIKIQLRGVDRR